jgi:hypothetical protein
MVLALRTVIALMLAGSLFVQLVMVPLLAVDMRQLSPEFGYLRAPILVIAVLGVVTIQVTLVCVWRLVTMVRRGTVFSAAAFRYVDVVIGAAVAAALLTFGLAVVLAPGEAVAPGIVLLICGAALGVLGVALVVLVMRTLLAQAVARDDEAHRMQAELDEVI